jgi:hypothetical protein
MTMATLRREKPSMRWAAQAGSEIGDLNCVCNQDTVAAANELHAMVHRPG